MDMIRFFADKVIYHPQINALTGSVTATLLYTLICQSAENGIEKQHAFTYLCFAENEFEEALDALKTKGLIVEIDGNLKAIA
jgi:hypothetical protein